MAKKVNHVVINGETVLDLRSDTVTPGSLKKGVTAHADSGQQIVGTAEEDLSLGVTSAAVGDFIRVLSVDSGGKPTLWEPVQPEIAEAIPLDSAAVGLGNVDNVKQYSATNPPPYPVTSVNGKTGAVTVPKLPTVTADNNLDTLTVIGGNWTTDHGAVGIQDAASLIVNKWPDNLTFVVKTFRRWGKLCLFTVQINVGTAISTNYGFTLFEMPYTSIDRVWINNQTQFFMDSDNVAVRVNDERLATGNYTLTGFYLTTDKAKVTA
nr:MAG TPA: hypothetical protein [Caudoviricetes sp.]